MISLPFYLKQSLIGYFFRRWQKRRFEKYALPGIKMAEVEGVKLDIAGLSLSMKQTILEGRYESSELAICGRLITRGERILEIGAGLGCVGLFCLKNLNAQHVISLEANPETAERLRRNYQINGFEAACIVAALAAEDGTVQLQTSSDFWLDSIHACGTAEFCKTIETRALTFSSILREVGSDFTTILLDVEGAEQYVAWQCIPPGINKVVIEIHPSTLGTPCAFDVLHHLMLQGFEVADWEGRVFGFVRKGVSM